MRVGAALPLVAFLAGDLGQGEAARGPPSLRAVRSRMMRSPSDFCPVTASKPDPLEAIRPRVG